MGSRRSVKMTSVQHVGRSAADKQYLVELVTEQIVIRKGLQPTNYDWNDIAQKFNAREDCTTPASKTELLKLWRALRNSAVEARQNCGRRVLEDPILASIDKFLQDHPKKTSKLKSSEKIAKPNKASVRIRTDLLKRSNRKLFSVEKEEETGPNEIGLIDDLNRVKDSRAEFLNQLRAKMPRRILKRNPCNTENTKSLLEAVSSNAIKSSEEPASGTITSPFVDVPYGVFDSDLVSEASTSDINRWSQRRPSTPYPSFVKATKTGVTRATVNKTRVETTNNCVSRENLLKSALKNVTTVAEYDVPANNAEITQSGIATNKAGLTQPEMAANNAGITQPGMAANNAEITQPEMAANNAGITQPGMTANNTGITQPGISAHYRVMITKNLQGVQPLSNLGRVTEMAKKQAGTTNIGPTTENHGTVMSKTGMVTSNWEKTGVEAKNSILLKALASKKTGTNPYNGRLIKDPGAISKFTKTYFFSRTPNLKRRFTIDTLRKPDAEFFTNSTPKKACRRSSSVPADSARSSTQNSAVLQPQHMQPQPRLSSQQNPNKTCLFKKALLSFKLADELKAMRRRLVKEFNETPSRKPAEELHETKQRYARELHEAQMALDKLIADQAQKITAAKMKNEELTAEQKEELHKIHMETARLKLQEAQTNNQIALLKLKMLESELGHVNATPVNCS